MCILFVVVSKKTCGQQLVMIVGVNVDLSIGDGRITSLKLRSSHHRIFVEIIFHLVETKHDFEGLLMKISGSGDFNAG